MRRLSTTAAILALILALGVGGIAAQKKPAKPAAKKPAAKTQTVQLPGGPGVFGTVYSLRKDTPLYFRLVKAEYTTQQVVLGETLVSPNASEKLLVLHFTIQNPLKTEQYVRWDSLGLTVVDKANSNHEGRDEWADEAGHKSFSMTMKPAQTQAVYTAIRVPADGIMPKLMVLPGEDNGPVLRYDLTSAGNKVARLAEPFADPSDPSGYTALETVKGVAGTLYPLGALSLSVEKCEYVDDKLVEDILGDEERFLVVTARVKNVSPAEEYLRWDSVTMKATSSDGEEFSCNDLLFETSNRSFSQNLKSGSEVRVRYLFAVPQDVTAKTLTISQAESRIYEIAAQ